MNFREGRQFLSEAQNHRWRKYIHQCPVISTGILYNTHSSYLNVFCSMKHLSDTREYISSEIGRSLPYYTRGQAKIVQLSTDLSSSSNKSHTVHQRHHCLFHNLTAHFTNQLLRNFHSICCVSLAHFLYQFCNLEIECKYQKIQGCLPKNATNAEFSM